MFEYDKNKSATNKDKHGICFYEAQRLWLDPYAIELKAKVSDEPRWLVVGKILDKFWSAIITHRGNNIRIISVRRSRKEEVMIYEQHNR